MSFDEIGRLINAKFGRSGNASATERCLCCVPLRSQMEFQTEMTREIWF